MRPICASLGLCMRIPPKNLILHPTTDMATVLGVVFFAYISLVFLVAHRICMLQCNPMSRPGVYQGDIGDIRFSGSHVETDGSHHNRREQQLNLRHIRFEPTYIDFHEHSVGMPSIQTVLVMNPHTDLSLHLQSVSGSSAHFHASFFQSRVLQPLGNTTFEIVFLARLVGNVENTLFIHTSKGVYPYQVFGVGVPNPYRLRPFLGARVPLNFSFSTVINMHNPYDSPLQVMEMYSSGGDLHLELPSGLEEAPQKHWEIPPYETKALMRVSFIGRVATNHTAFIRIKASKPAPNQELLILPVEVEVTTAPGLFSSADMLDFGTLRTMDEPKSIGLYLLNAGHKQVHISAVTVDPPNSALSINFTPALLKPLSKYIKIATATYSAYHVKRNRQANGKVVIKTNSRISPRLEIPYQVNILQGTIAYSVSKTRFFVGKPPFFPVVRELPITNTFNFNMIIYDAAFPSDVEDVFSIVNFTKPVLIAPQKTAIPFYVQFYANGSDIAFSTILRVYTNASIFTLPIHCYDGKLKYVIDGLEEDVMEYGTVGTGENRTKLLKILNLNPIEVAIHRIACNLHFARIRLLDLKSNDESSPGNHSPPSGQSVISGESHDPKVSIKSGYLAIFSVEVTVPKKEGQYIGEVEMETAYEILDIPIHLKSMDGKLYSSPASVLFPPGFPGRKVNHSLTLFSSFSHALKLVSIKPYPEDDRFFFEPYSLDTKLLPSEKIQVGHLVYDPMRGCKDLCYTGIGTRKVGDEWLSSLSLPPNIGELDAQLIEKHQEMYSSIERSGKNKLNISFVIDTDVVKRFHVLAQASLTWPSLSPDKPIKFPLTHLGNQSVRFFRLENPADITVVAQIVPLCLYPQLQGVWDVLADRFDTDAYGLDPDDSAFTIPAAAVLKENSISSSYVGAVPVVNGERAFISASGTLVTLLKPRSTVNIPIQFEPKDERLTTSVVLIRNNLTILDGLVVQGQGARGEFTLNGKRPGIHSTLLFEIKPSQLTDCHKAAPRSRSLSSLSVMKTVTATNPGQLAMFVSSLSINGNECEGYGFKIMNCKSFILKPNTSRKIEITFTPDFTMSRVTRKLEVKTTLGPVMEFTLVATIPPHLLPLCSAALGRNSWEPIIQGVAVVFMGMVFLAVVIAAYAEARRLVFLSHPEMQLLQMKEEEQGTPIFDLTTIAGVKKHKLALREEPSLGSRRSRKDPRESKESSPASTDKTFANANGTATSLLSNPPTNNNIKNVTGSTSWQENDGNRGRNTRTEVFSNSQLTAVESADNRLSKSLVSPLESTDSFNKRTWSWGKDGKSKNSTESRVKNVAETGGNPGHKVTEANKVELRPADERRKSDGKHRTCSVGTTETEVTSPSSSKCEMVPKRDCKETKGKQKKKTKEISKKEKEQRLKNKEVTTAKDDGTLSDDSCSDGSSDKSLPEVRIQQPSKDSKTPRRGSLPSDSQLSTFREQQNYSKSGSRAATTESIDACKERGKSRKNQVATDAAVSKAKKAELQSPNGGAGGARPKSLDVPSKSSTSGQTSKNQNSSNSNSPVSGKPNHEVREPGPTSPHAIAAAVMSLALGKSMQTSSKENNFDNQEKASKAYTKSSALSPTLSSSPPPPVSPTSLSGSSRSSSYSSIVSSDSSNGADQVRLPVVKGNKSRLKNTKSAPMEGRVSPSWSSGGFYGSRKGAKPADELGLSSLRRGRWGVSLDSAVPPVSPRSPVGEQPEVLSSQYVPPSRASLLEHHPTLQGMSRKEHGEVSEKKRPFDLNDLGLSDASAVRRRSYRTSHPRFWKSGAEKSFDNPNSLFSSSSCCSTDENFYARRSNNWVNFLDASNTCGVVTSNKSMAEIWDAGNSPLDSDGWSLYTPVQPSSTSGPTLTSEANAVDALFSQMPEEWPAPIPDSTFSTQEISWTPPPDAPSIWGNGYLVPSNPESLPTCPKASFASFPVQPQQNQESSNGHTTCTFEPLGSLSSSSIWNPSTVSTTWSSPSE